MEKHAVAEISLKERAMQELSKVDAGIVALKAQYGSKVYDCTKTIDMAQAKADRVAIREVRYQVPKIAESVTKQLNNLKNDIKSEAERIVGELLEIEKVSDDAIKAEEERKSTEKAEKDRLAAEAQKVLDDKIIAIGKLPLTCIGKSIPEVEDLLARLEPHPIGAEFTRENRNRAEVAKTEALDAIRGILAGMVRAEEVAAQIKAEQEAEAARLEEEQRVNLITGKISLIRSLGSNAVFMSVEQIASKIAELEERGIGDLEFEEFRTEAQDAKISTLQTLTDELQEKQAASELLKTQQEELAKAQKDLADSTAKFELQQAEARKAQEAIDSVAKEAHAKEEAGKKRIQDEADTKKREEDRLAALETEKKRLEAEKKAKEAEKEKKLAEKARKLAEAKCETASVAFHKILVICRDTETYSPAEALEAIAILAEGNL
jgi:hypothetical protein